MKLTGIIIESFGSGNASSRIELLELLKEAVLKNKVLINITQCLHGKAVEEKYATSELFVKSGVLCGKDLTLEAAITKLMFLLGQNLSLKKTKDQMKENLRGEMTI